MDANGQRFWMLAGERDFRARAHLAWDQECRVLQLASERTLPAPADPAAAFAAANGALEAVPCAADRNGAVAHFDSASNSIVARSHLPGEAVLLTLDGPASDFTVGADDVLYLALADRIQLHDLRGRWADVAVSAPGFTPWRLAADPAGGVWALERASGRLARLRGLPLPKRPFVDPAPGVFRPEPENCAPPQLTLLPDPGWPLGERPLALACAPAGGLALLSWVGDGEARLRRYDPVQGLATPIRLAGARYAYALAWIDDRRIAVRMPGRRDAPAFDLALAVTAADRSHSDVACSGEIYPLADDALDAPFAHRCSGPPLYPVKLDGASRGAEPLFRLSIANLARRGAAQHFDAQGARLLDSGAQDTVWHRLYVEASLPPRCGLVIWLAATPYATPPDPARNELWSAHRAGLVPESEVPLAFAPATPVAAFEHLRSELPNHPGLGPWPDGTPGAGLYSLLIQQSRSRVRALSGRYLWLRVELFGDGRSSPSVAALRAWGSRFSYRDRYLPRLYRESLFGPAASTPGLLLGQLDQAPVLAGTLVPTLDAGQLDEPTLAAALARLGIEPGAGARLLVERAGESWLLRDGASSRRIRLDADAHGIPHLLAWQPQATPADFLERLLGNFEGLLTPLEDRIASAHLLSAPASTPEPALDWLAAWVGVAFDPVLPAERRRDWLAASAALAQWHGTLRGLRGALDIASGGGVRDGRIVVIEDFRLRRLLATLLGVDLSDQDDPLLPGLTGTVNSVVGDSAFLGEAASDELLALFRTEVASAAENRAVAAFYDRLAFRATVLVHQDIQPEDFGLLRRIAELEAPAHVEVRVVAATWPFLAGVASLVGVDTFLGPPRPSQPVRLDVSGLGQGDLVLGTAPLDPRLDGAAAPSPPPLAQLATGAGVAADGTAPFGSSFDLDGSASRAAPGRRIDQYLWQRLPPS